LALPDVFVGAGEVTGVPAFEALFFLFSFSSSALTRSRSAAAFAAAALNAFVSSALARSAAVERSGRSACAARAAPLGGGGDGGGVGAVSTASAISAASAKATSRASSAAESAPPLALLELGLAALPEAPRLAFSLDLSPEPLAGAASLAFSFALPLRIQKFLPFSFKFKMRFDLLYPTFLQHRTIP
jgi:hypothetical protein